MYIDVYYLGFIYVYVNILCLLQLIWFILYCMCILYDPKLYLSICIYTIYIHLHVSDTILTGPQSVCPHLWTDAGYSCDGELKTIWYPCFSMGFIGLYVCLPGLNLFFVSIYLGFIGLDAFFPWFLTDNLSISPILTVNSLISSYIYLSTIYKDWQKRSADGQERVYGARQEPTEEQTLR